jgi:hypothetical protein
MGSFADQFHIERIRAALWRDREFGHASVMVGAGFSLNAVPISPSTPRFPTWFDLAKRLVNELYPKGSTTDSERDRIVQHGMATSGALRLAEEYEAAFGRDALESFLLEAIPDLGHQPSGLHRLLLKLPWADVLTTNYDTLLERAADGVVDRKYDVVRTAADIPGAARPRIVKLHGSFPSSRPFIFTEEDFRTYPRRFAPFVNVAQEVAMETVLCLVGFSGDDPNFLYWTGWVRDHLGASAPQIYLCGLLNLNTARRNLLHQRNVVPVDLSPLFPAEAFPDKALRNAKAIEWFLLNLEAGQPPLRLFWPNDVVPERSIPSSGLPPIIEPPHRRPAKEISFSTDTIPPGDHVEQLTNTWRDNRKLYPGWLIAPRSTRTLIWEHTKHWLGALMPELEKLPLPKQLSFLFEANWRLECALIPLSNDLASVIAKTLLRINPFPNLLSLGSDAIAPSSSGSDAIDWTFARGAWVSLAVALLRLGREDQVLSSFDEWMQRLRIIERDERSIRSRLFYEECLFALGRLDRARAQTAVERWSDEPEDDPFWGIRRAAILAELGQLRDATRLASSSLRDIRQKLRAGVDDIPMLSREGWAMVLVDSLEFAQSLFTTNEHRDFRGRWDQLEQYKCNPQRELSEMRAEIEKEMPAPRPAVVHSYGLDGSLSRSRSHVIGGDGTQGIPGLQAVRMAEEGGYPPSCGNLDLAKGMLLRACKLIAPFSPETVNGILFRCGDDSAVTAHYSLPRIALLDEKSAAALREFGTSSLLTGLKSLEAPAPSISSALGTGVEKQIDVAVSLLVAIAPRLPESAQVDEIRKAIQLYLSPTVRQSISLYDPLKAILKSSLRYARPQAIAEVLLDLLALPIPGSAGFEVLTAELWPEPFHEVTRNLMIDSRSKDDKRWDATIDGLIADAANSHARLRERAVLRLGFLHSANLLTASEESKLGVALWSQTNEATGLPSGTGLYDYAFINLPGADIHAAVEKFKSYYLALKLRPLVTKVKLEGGREGQQFPIAHTGDLALKSIGGATLITRIKSRKDPGQRIDWTTDQAEVLLKMIDDWWQSEGRDMPTSVGPPGWPMATGKEVRVESCIEVLRDVILPRLAKGGSGAKQAGTLITQFQKSGFRVQSAFPELLRLFPERSDEVGTALRQGLVSGSFDDVWESIEGVYVWIVNSESGILPHPPPDLLNEVGNLIASRRQPALLIAMQYARLILERYPKSVGAAFLNSVSIGLRYLLSEATYRRGGEDAASPPMDQVAPIRVAAARLAKAVANCTESPDAAITEWVLAAATDPITQVRLAVAEPSVKADGSASQEDDDDDV